MRRLQNSIRSPEPVAPQHESFAELLSTARQLLGPGGCPWDRAQTISSLLPHLIEEVWEAFEAHRRKRWAALEEELGDVFYTVIFLGLLAELDGRFTMDALLERTRAKMIRRHPHVFGNQRAATADEAYRHWQAVKRLERPATRFPSRSKQLRPLLVALWDLLLQNARAKGALEEIVERLGKAAPRPTSARTPKPPSASKGPRPGRSERLK